MRKLAICLIVSVVLMSFTVAGIAGTAEKRQGPKNDKFLTQLIPGFLVKPHEAYEWHLYKDMGGATYSGNPSWKSYMEFIEWKLEHYGVKDITRNKWTYDRWYTTDWPGDGKWTLTSNGISIKVASYGAYSGATTEAGTTAQLIYYDPASPPPLSSLAGKIVVFKTAPHPNPPFTSLYKAFYTVNDYEFMTDSETFPPLFTHYPVSVSVNTDVWYQLGQTSGFINILKASGAAGGIFVSDASYDRLAGLYTFGVPVLYNAPSLFLDRVAGSQVIEDAKNGKIATLKLVAKVEPTETYQLIGFLPGSNYGKPEDEIILLVSHTDGPSISQENGALGVLGIVHYFSHIPQSERPRTLMIFLDNRHYMPGMESAFANFDWFKIHPEAVKPIVASVGTEHLGQVEYREVGEVFEPTGLVETSFLWARNNQLLIDMAIDAVKDHQWPRVQVQCTERPGIHGQQQGVWYGMGAIASSFKIPGFGTMGTQGAYWATTARIKDFDADLFCTQVATMSQLTGGLMLANLIAIDPLWGNLRTALAGLPSTAFVDPTQAATQQSTLLNEIDVIFNQVKDGDYANAMQGLTQMSGQITTWIVPASQTALIAQINNAIAKL